MANQASRTKLLEAALRLFSQRGYSDSTTVEIARAADVNERTLFRHFDSKDALLTEAVEYFGSRAADVDWSGLDAELTYHDVAADLVAIFRDYYRVCYANVDLLRVFVANAPFVESLRSNYLHPLPTMAQHARGYFSILASTGVISSASAEVAANLLVAHVHRTVYDLYMHEHRRKLTPRLETRIAIDSERQARFFATTLLLPAEATGR